jgi:RHS repeat-associated protein
VEFFANGTSIGVDATSPYSVTWTPPAPNTYTLKATATDISKGTTTSSTVSITALGPPTVGIQSPANNATFTPGSSIPISATVSVSGTTIKQVDFFVNGVNKGTDTTPPTYSTAGWTNVAAGTYTVTAKATDNKGGTNTSSPVTVTVANPHNPPTVSITSAAAGTVSQAPATITVNASAFADTGSSISYVDFSNGVTTIRSSNPPYSATWSNVGPGGYLLSAKAVDSTLASTTSSLLYAIVDGADSCITTPPISAAESATKFAAYGNLPLAFEENVGQSDARVKFLSRGPGYQLFLAQSSSTLALRSEEGKQAALRLRFADANDDPAMTGLDRQPTTTNYLAGSDPSSWRTHVANFAKVRYEQIYPGIDAVYRASQGKLEYDLIVEPRADPSRVRLAFDGVEGLLLDENGALILRTAAGAIKQWKPVAYQHVDGMRKEVTASYRLIDGSRVAFELGAYDRDQTLIIDPVLVYSTYLSGTDDASGASAIAISRCGEAFVAGWTWATTYPTTTGAFDTMGEAQSRMGFVSKLNQSGTGLLYSTFVSGIHFSTANGDIAQNTDLVSIAVDSTGHAYVAGSTNSSDFPVTPGALMTAQGPNPGGVLAKLNTDGSALIYATYTSFATVVGVAVDSSGNAYIAETPRTVQKISPSGTAPPSYTVTVGGSGGSDAARAIAVDASGNAYVTGVTTSSIPGTLFVSTGAFETTWPATSTSLPIGFVQKLNPAGTIVYGTYFGSRGTLQPTSIAIDSSQRIYVAGFSDGQGFPVMVGGGHMFNMDLDQAGNQYAFAGRLSADGSHLDYFSRVGGMLCPTSTCSVAQTRANSIAVDALSNTWIAGFTRSNRIPLTKPIYANFAASGGDNFIVKLDPTGNTMVFGTLLNGTTLGTATTGRTGSNATGIQVDAIGSAYVTGWTDKVNFPTTAGAYQSVPRSNIITNAFVTKINETKDTTTALSVSPNPGNVGSAVTLTATVTGNAPTGTVTFFDAAVSVGSAALSGTTAQLVTSTLTGGVHSLTASYGGDAHNNSSASTVVSLNLTNSAGHPTVSMTGIVDGASLTVNSGSVYTGAQVTVNANAAAGNTLSSVTVYFGSSTYFWTPNSSSFTGSVTLPSLNPGFYTIWTTVVDNFGNSTSTPVVRFIVNSAAIAPTGVAITAPANGASFLTTDSITLTAAATPSSGHTISGVTYYQGASSIGFANTIPFTASWTSASPGTYSLIAVAQDSGGGGRTLSAPITITVTSPPPPSVSLNSPTNGASFTAPAPISLAATAIPANGATISKVEYFDGSTLVGTSNGPTPYPFSWTGATGGTHVLTAKATDNRLATATSAPVTITVVTPPPPTVSVTAPADGASFTGPASIAFTASASGVGGATITRLELYAGSMQVGTGTSATWNVVAPGTYALTAKAFDSNGTTATSSPVSVTIVGDPNEKITFIHNDFAGNAIAATDVNGAVLWKENYTPFGLRQVNATASSSSHQWFGGKIQDGETGLSYFGARYYDPVVGRFMGIDAIGFDDSHLKGFNRYAYGYDNPLLFLDPDGNDPQATIRPTPDNFFRDSFVGRIIADTISPVALFTKDNVNPLTGNMENFSGDKKAEAVIGILTLGLGGEGRAGSAVLKEVKAFSKEKQALVEMAKADKRKGITQADMDAYKELNRGLSDPFPADKVRGWEAHKSGNPSSQSPHGHVGPVDHIPITDVVKP